MQKFPASGEINRRVDDAAQAISTIGDRYRGEAIAVDTTDGISMEFPNWRFNLRSSNTEPVIRLNVESRADSDLMQARVTEMLEILDTLG
jgi:phosphomannomutase